MTKDNEVHGLHKVPDQIIIKSLRTEIGKLNSYILELEEAANGKLESTRITHLENCLAQKNKVIESLKQEAVEQQRKSEELMYKNFNSTHVPTAIVKLRKLTTIEKATAANKWASDRSEGNRDVDRQCYYDFLMGAEAAERLLMKEPI